MRAAGWLVEAVPNGENAIFVAAVLPPDAIVFDLRPPVVGGLETIRRLKMDEDTWDVPIVAISGSGCISEIEAKAAGCDALVARPFDPDALRELLEAVVAGRRGVLVSHTRKGP